MSRSAASTEPIAMALPGFVGRDQELAALTSAMAKPPAIVLVEGEPGIGKSRLVTEFLTRTSTKPLLTACPPFRQPYTLGPIVDGVRHAADHITGRQLSALAGALRPLFPEWAAGLPPALEPLEDASASRHRLFRALAELLGSLNLHALVVEDLQWADEATLEFLLFLVARRPQPLSLLMTCRPDDLPEDSLLPLLSSRPPAGMIYLRLPLRPLDVPGTAALMSSMLSGELVSTGFAEFVHQHTEGVPLAVEESVRLMADRADLTRRGGEWVRRKMNRLSVPPAVRDAVLERVRRLSEDAQAVLRAAAVLTDPVDESVLAVVSGLSAERAGAGLAIALDSGLIGEDARRLVSFRHVLARQAVHEATPAPLRKQLHLRAGQALERLSPTPMARLARHFREAGDNASWCHYAEQAADQALAAGDDQAAITLLHDAITGGGLPASDLARLAGKIPLAALRWDGRYPELIAALRVGLDDDRADPVEQAKLRFQLGLVYSTMADYETSRIEFERAVPRLPRGSVESAKAMMLLGTPHDPEQPSAMHRRWLRRAAQEEPALPAAYKLRFRVDLTTALLMLGDSEGWAQAQRLPAEAGTVRERLQITRSVLNVSDLAIMWGRYADARQWLDRGLAVARGHDFSRPTNELLLNEAHLHWFTAEWPGLAERADLMAISDDLIPLGRAEAVLIRGRLHAVAGDHGRAADCFAEVLTAARRYGWAKSFMQPAAALASLRLADGDAEEALRVTDEPVGIVATKRIWIWGTDLLPARIDALITVGRTAEAHDLVSAFARGLRGRDAPAASASLAQCRAILAEADGAHARAAALFARTAAAWRALPRPYDALLAAERQANCLIAGGQGEPGLELLARTLDQLAALGASAGADRVARTLRERGVAVSRPWLGGRRGYGDQLSPRELDVVRLVIAGRTNLQIAAQLHRSRHTVGTQLRSAMRKLNVTSRTALAVSAAEAGVTD